MDDSPEPDLLFTFGIIADIQYADRDNGYNFAMTRKRYYRNSLTLLKGAVEEWANETIQPKFILQLGDIIDGFNTRDKKSHASLKMVLGEMEKLDIQFHHIWGNHEFYNFKRKELTESQLNTMPLEDMMDRLTTVSKSSSVNDEFYAYYFSPHENFRFLLIDTFDLSTIGREKSCRKHDIAMKLLKKKNPNEDLNSPTGLEEKQFVQFNGGISKTQLDWINRVLTSSDEKGERVVVVGHLPVHPDSTDPVCLVWNYQEVLATLQRHPCVVGYFAGHDHDGGYCVDNFGIHHITFEGVIETPPESQAFATVYVYDDKMVLKGRGLVSNRTLPYREVKKVQATP